MEKSAYWLGFREFVVKRHCFFGWQDVSGDLPFLQKIQRLARDMKAFGHSARKHDHCSAMIQQFSHVGDCDSRIVTSPSLAPIPISLAPREKLCVVLCVRFARDFLSTRGTTFVPRWI